MERDFLCRTSAPDSGSGTAESVLCQHLTEVQKRHYRNHLPFLRDRVFAVVQDPYLEEILKGDLPVGAPVFIFFRIAGTYVTDSPQILNVNAAADLAVARNLRVRITGAADSATGSAEKNAALAKTRAEHVASLMEKRGVPKDRIEVLSEGGTAAWEPVSANRNCRIELFWQ